MASWTVSLENLDFDELAKGIERIEDRLEQTSGWPKGEPVYQWFEASGASSRRYRR